MTISSRRIALCGGSFDPVHLGHLEIAKRAVDENVRASLVEQLEYAFQLCTSRRPTDRESLILSAAFTRRRTEFRDNPQAAKELLSVGESPRDESLDPADLAAWTTIMSLLLNLDEAVTKG